LKNKIEAFEQRTEYILNHHPFLKNTALKELKDVYFYEYIRITLNSHQLDTDGKIRRELHRRFCQSGAFKIYIFTGFRRTFSRILFRFCPNLFVKLYSIINMTSR
jgi:hypothetical protein